MGKIKRAREKFHIASAKLGTTAAANIPDETKEIQGLPIKDWPVQNNIFDGININLDLLKKSLIEDDKISIRSVAKSCKYDKNGKLLTKQEKRKLKHELFLNKIDALEQMKKEAKRKRKKRKPIVNVEQEGIQTPLKLEKNNLPDLTSKFEIKNIKKVENKRGIKKSKDRKKDLLDGVTAFRKILSSSAFRSNPQKLISKSIHKLALS